MLDFHDTIAEQFDQAVHQQVFPGAVWATGSADAVLDFGACGLADPTNPTSAMRSDMLFDVASLTKILAVWTVIGTIWHDGMLPLDDPLATIWPEVVDYPIGQVTARQLLTHTAGLPLRSNLKNLYGTDPQSIRDGILREQLHRPPGEAVEYTNRAGLILGFLAEHLTTTPLDQLATERIWKPLGMTSTRFGPLPATDRSRCAPTELDSDTGTRLKGVVHDYSARLLGGVCGSAGVFSTLPDLTRFLQHLLSLGSDPDRAGFGPAWLAESLQVHTGDLTPPWGLFWFPPPGQEVVYVHYGFTGTGMWLSPKQDRWAVMLTNKLYYSSDRTPIMNVRGVFRAAIFG
ncbi:serine hydrolase domain-containing protein [Sphaerisporangium sp. NPDC051017]|uniref:serine hydrolase domain-containing protein n=1 Tax=Sphaerisporangium sp. NPDC051017 TaxID=3154636 RepID=UPI0034427F3A